MIVQEISKDVWNDKVETRLKSVFFEIKFLEQIAYYFELKLDYFYCVEDKELLFAAAIFKRNTSVITPLAFTYCPVYFDSQLTDSNYLDLFNQFINLLKLKSKKINLRLGPDFSDLRPFIWQGFNVALRYTYIKVTETSFHANINKTLTKNKIKSLSFIVEPADKQSISDNLLESLKFGISRKQFNYYMSFFGSLSADKLKVCKVYSDGVLVCAELMLLDAAKDTAYALLILASEHPLAHRFLHKKAIEWCHSKNFRYYDFCGANDESIARFKRYFKPELKPYYLVDYNPRKIWLKEKSNNVIKFVKRYLLIRR